jgi:hypothetical protein
VIQKKTFQQYYQKKNNSRMKHCFSSIAETSIQAFLSDKCSKAFFASHKIRQTMMGVCSPSVTEKGHPYCSVACAKGRDDTGSSHVTAERAEQAQVSCLHNANLTRSLMDMVAERERASEMCAHTRIQLSLSVRRVAELCIEVHTPEEEVLSDKQTQMTFSRFQTTVGQTGTVQQGQGC